MMKRTIFYFSATGNSLYVAEQLKGEYGYTLSIPQLMKTGQREFEADEMGFVFPMYMHLAPQMVQEFIAGVRLKADYLFAILTYGARTTSAVELWQDVASKAGYHFDYINTVKMVDNWLHHFDMDEQKRMDKHIPEQLRGIEADLAVRRHWVQPVSDEERRQHNEAYHLSGLDKTGGFVFHSEEHFVVTSDCIRCGICTKVCPRGNWKLGVEKAETAGRCDYCLACIHNCPKKAILFAKSSNPFLKQEANPHARYRNPYVSVRQIQEANNQYK